MCCVVIVCDGCELLYGVLLYDCLGRLYFDGNEFFFVFVFEICVFFDLLVKNCVVFRFDW